MAETSRYIDTTVEQIIPPQAQFFCLIGKYDSPTNLHTFVHIGYVDEQGTAHTLLELGKLSDRGLKYKDEGLATLANVLTSHTGAVICSEHHQLQPYCSTQRSFPINYSAYQVTKEQYLYFLSLLKQINLEQEQLFEVQVQQRLQKEIQLGLLMDTDSAIEARKKALYRSIFRQYGLWAFQPDPQTGTYRYKSINEWDGPSYEHLPHVTKQQGQEIIKRCQSLSLSNTCRHTGLDFLFALLNGDKKAYQSNVPAWYAKGMSCRTVLSSGGYQTPLIILPAPPSSYQLPKAQKQILYTLYLRMENLLKRNYSHPATIQKYDMLCDLYKNLVSDKMPMLDFLEAIDEYSSAPITSHIIDCERDWFRMWLPAHKTETRQMFKKFHDDLEVEISQQQKI